MRHFAMAPMNLFPANMSADSVGVWVNGKPSGVISMEATSVRVYIPMHMQTRNPRHYDETWPLRSTDWKVDFVYAYQLMLQACEERGAYINSYRCVSPTCVEMMASNRNDVVFCFDREFLEQIKQKTWQYYITGQHQRQQQGSNSGSESLESVWTIASCNNGHVVYLADYIRDLRARIHNCPPDSIVNLNGQSCDFRACNILSRLVSPAVRSIFTQMSQSQSHFSSMSATVMQAAGAAAAAGLVCSTTSTQVPVHHGNGHGAPENELSHRRLVPAREEQEHFDDSEYNEDDGKIVSPPALKRTASVRNHTLPNALSLSASTPSAPKSSQN